MPEEAGCRIHDSGFRRAERDSRVGDSQSEAASCRVVPALNLQSSRPNPVVGTLLAFDFGTRRIGVAVGNTFSGGAQPLLTIAEEKNDLRFAVIGRLIQEWQPCALLVGLPSNEDGTSHELTSLCRRFANRLHGRFALTTLLVDERFTSLAASEQLNKQGIRGRQQKSRIDQYAAQQIMQAWFDEPAACVIVGADRGKDEKSATE